MWNMQLVTYFDRYNTQFVKRMDFSLGDGNSFWGYGASERTCLLYNTADKLFETGLNIWIYVIML